MQRRNFIKKAGLASLATSTIMNTSLLSKSKKRPNFIFIYTDDQRYDCMGVVQKEQGDLGRFPWLETPNMDRMAENGFRFRNAFVVHSLCTPSRASFLTGQYTHTHGIFTNFIPFPENMSNFGRTLTQAGYETAYIGKWHMGRQAGRRPGFKYSASFKEQGQYFDCPFDVEGVETPTTGWVDDVSTDYALDYLEKNRDNEFAMVLGFKTPHNPFIPPPRFKDKYKGCLMGPAQNHFELPIYVGRVHVAYPEHEKLATAQTGNRPIEDTMDYFRTITAADENLGRVLDKLDDLGLTENTMVIFTSDNGYHLREKGIGDKRSAYEVSMRIPMLVQYPTLGKGKIDGMALNIDVAPTLLDFAGLPIPKEIQGKSWRPLLEGKKEKIRDAFLYEYFFSYGDITDYEAQTADPPITPTLVAVRTDKAKIIKYPGRTWVEMFDLEKDPYERRNVADDPEYAELRQTMEKVFDQQVKETGYKIPEKAKFVPLEGLEEWRRQAEE